MRDFGRRVLRRILYTLGVTLFLAVCILGGLYYLKSSGHWPGGWTGMKNHVDKEYHEGIKGLGKLVGQVAAIWVGGYVLIAMIDESLGGPPPPNGNDPNRYPSNDPRNRRY